MPKKLTTLQRILIPLIIVGFVALGLTAERSFSNRVKEIRYEALNEAEELTRLLSMSESLVGERVTTSMLILQEHGLQTGNPKIVGNIKIGNRSVPNLMLGDKPQTGQFDLVDKVAEIGGGTATLFVKSGQDFIRIATNVKNSDGLRAIGSTLDPRGKAYAAISHGKSFYGVVDILGQPYITGYEPMLDHNKQLVGAWYVGYKVDVKALDQAIREWDFLENGFAAVIDYKQHIHFVSGRTSKTDARRILTASPDDWIIIRKNVPSWNFQAVIAYPKKEGWMMGLSDAGFLVALLTFLGCISLGMTFFGIKRFVFKPLGGDPDTATSLVQRIANGDFTDDGTRADAGTLMANVVEMRSKLGLMVSTLRQNTERMTLSANVFNHAHDGIFITDHLAKIIEINPAFSKTTGYSREQAIDKHPWELGLASSDERFFTRIWHDPDMQGAWHGETWNRREDGDVYATQLDLFIIRDDDGALRNYVGVFSDITEAKEQQLYLEHLAYHDSLTQLPNRTLFSDRLQQALARASRNQEFVAIGYFDLDMFKPVNDSLGHDAGDKLLVQLASRIRTCLRESDTIARMGGDEFAVLLCSLKSIEEIHNTLNRLLQVISEPFTIDKKTIHISASIGVTIFPTDNNPPDTLLRHADHAMYQAKISGGSRYHLFDAEHDRQTQHTRVQRSRLELALHQNEFVLYYQPKINLHTGEIFSFEALIRWQHPEHGLRMPGEFLPQIENTDFIIPLGEWVIETALTQLFTWKSLGLETCISVNIAAKHITQPNFVERITHILHKHHEIPPQRLILEITETAAIQDINELANIISQCKAIGVSFALDDFGVGYSSLTYLRRLPVDIVKIDQSFVRDMLHDTEDLAMVMGIISLSRDFNRHVVAEGIETAQHGKKLLEMGCELGQGYGIAKPMPADQVITWVHSHNVANSQ